MLLGGLANLGNTCYMNSTLQCLAHVPALTRYFSSGAWQRDVVASSSQRAALVASLVRSYAELLGRLDVRNGGGGGGVFAPRSLKAIVGSALTEHGMFANSAQHDAHELLRFLLDALSEGLNTVRVRVPYVELKEPPHASDADVAEMYRSYYAARSSSVVSALFRGAVRSAITCDACRTLSRSFDPFEELCLPISRALQGRARAGDGACATLPELLGAFTTPEVLDGAEAWKCPRCAAPRRATKATTLHALPDVLVLVLKRFYYSALRRCKVDTPVMLDPAPGALDVGPYCSATAPLRAAARYSLIGVVNHSGDTWGGHYTADCLVEGAGWHRFNDSHVSPCAPPRGASAAPYVLIYVRAGGGAV